MLMLTGILGDIYVSLISAYDLNTDEQGARSTRYELHFKDIPSEKSQVLVYQHENEAVLAFAAWLAADEELDWFGPAIDNLRAKIGSTRYFLP